VGAAVGLAAVIALTAANTVSYFAAVRWVEHSQEVRQQADGWVAALLDAETGTRGYIASGRPEFLDVYHLARAHERELAASLRRLVAENATQLHNVDIADRDARGAMAALDELSALVQAGLRDQAIARLDESKRRMDAIREDVRSIRFEEDRLLLERRFRASRGALLILVSVLLLSSVSGALLAVAWVRERKREGLLIRLAREARARLNSLSDLATALSNARARSEVAEAVVDQGMRAAAADTCTLYALDETGTVLELIGDRGAASEVIDKIRRITETAGNPETFATMKSGVAIWAESKADYAAVFPALATMNVPGRRAKAFWSLPLIVEGRPVGLLGMGFYDARGFSPDERAFVETLTKQCAQALLRASRLEREDEARRQLTTTLRSIGDAVIATDPEGRVTFMNPIAESLTGWAESEARGRPLDEVFCIYSEATRIAAESPVARVLREGKVIGLANHTVLRSKRGHEIPIADSGAPIVNESGRLLGVVLVFRDATRETRDRLQREFLAKAGEALVSSLDYQATLATVARLAVPTLADWCAVDLMTAGGTAAQQAAVAHVDPTKVLFARELGERYPPDPNAKTGAPQVIRSGKSELYAEIPPSLVEAAARDTEHLRILRELQLESAMVVPLRGRSRTLGAITFIYAGSARRYTEEDLVFVEDFARRAAMAIENAMALKEAEEARAQERFLRSEAEVASRAKDEFLAMVSHELRTPLNAILGWAVTLRSRGSTADHDRGLSIIERNARTQAKLIDDVLDVARIISGKLALSLGPTNVIEAVVASIETVTPAAEAKHITVVSEFADAPLTITADADRVQQIVWNLLSNAVKFTPKGGSVSVKAFREGSDVCIRVSDTGEGIRPQALPLVFEPFHQADSSTTRRHGGLGLGLAIVKQLVSAHGGTALAKSEGEGKGATFIVQLPARSAVPAIAKTPRSTALDLGAATAALRNGPPRLDGLRLLVIDDEEDALALVKEVLEFHGAEVHLAGSAAEALDQFARVRPDVIVSDVGMPVVDGYSFIRQIRALPAELGGRTPAVALTAYARNDDAQRAFAAGYQMHVPKPVEPAQLATVVANLGGRSMEDGP
jgi:PAS domain S-box-containing protein